MLFLRHNGNLELRIIFPCSAKRSPNPLLLVLCSRFVRFIALLIPDGQQLSRGRKCVIAKQ